MKTTYEITAVNDDDVRFGWSIPVYDEDYFHASVDGSELAKALMKAAFDELVRQGLHDVQITETTENRRGITI